MSTESFYKTICFTLSLLLASTLGVENDLLAKTQEIEFPAAIFPNYPKQPLRGASITINEDETIVEEVDLPPDTRPPLSDATPEQVRRGEEILRKTAKFFESQDSIAFKARQHIGEEGTMGFVGGDSQIEIRYLRPGQLIYRWQSLDQKDSAIEVQIDRQFSIRREYGRCFISEAPQTLKELINSDSLKPSDAWRFDAPRILSLFDSATIDSLIESCHVSYRGTRDFGPVKTDQIILDGGGPTPNDWWSFRWELFVAQGDRPVPVYLRPDFDGLFPSLKGKARWSASDTRFTDWSFENIPAERFQIKVSGNEELVDSRNALGVGEPQALNPMVGKPLPKFQASDKAGIQIGRDDIIGNGPLVLILWGSENASIGPWWKQFDSIRRKYQPQGVRFETLHIGNDQQLASGLAQWKADPPILKLKGDAAGFAEGSSAFDWYGNRKPIAPGKTIQAYIVDDDGVTQQIIERGPKLVDQMSVQLDGLLDGRDMASENAKAIAEQKLARQSLIERVNNRITPSEDNYKPAAEPENLNRNIKEELRSDPELAFMNQALTDAGMIEQFGTGMEATVFIPKLELFESAGDPESDLKEMQNWMQYHIVFGTLTDEWFQKNIRVLTQQRIEDQFVAVGVSIDQDGTKRVNGIPILKTVEAPNGRIFFIDGILDPSLESTKKTPDFSKALRSKTGYQMMARLMDLKPIREALEKVQSATLFAVPDKTLARVGNDADERAEFVINNLIVPGRFDSKRLSVASIRWLLPLSNSGPTSGWAVNSDENSFKLFQIGPEGLPAKEIMFVETDIDTENGVIHLLQGLPKTASMTRGGLLERKVCRDILQSAIERSEIRLSRGETNLSLEILESVLDGQAAATFDTATICKSYLSADAEPSNLPEFVPARTFTILNSAFVAGLLLDESETDRIQQIYRSAIELARMTIDPEAIAATNKNTALPTLRDQFNAYREAVDLARYTLRLRGQTDKGWLGERDLFNPNR
ncbi:MAG: fasciclin domain-containing protein [Planctomycetota bacterium]